MFIPLHDANKISHIKLQYVTLLIIVINVLIWLFYQLPGFSGDDFKQAAFYSFGYIPAVANGTELLDPKLQILPNGASYLSYAFFHGGFFHLAGNMLFIWVFGDNVEDAIGHTRFILFYGLCAAAAAFLHGLLQPQSAAPLIGASGAAAGIIGAYLLLHPNVRIWVLAFGRIPLRLPALYVLGAWIAFQLIMLFIDPDGEISFAAHIGGFVAGMVLVVFLRRSDVALLGRGSERETI